MTAGALVREASARLAAAALATAVLDVHAVRRNGAHVVVIGLASVCTVLTRQQIHRALLGLPYECVDVGGPPRAVLEGRSGTQDDQIWRIGTQNEVAWIQDGTSIGLAITAAIPAGFDGYATVVIPEGDAQRRVSDSTLLRLLTAQSPGQPWWLGYLETGAHDVVFEHAPRVTLYTGWPYVLVAAGPRQAGTWRADDAWRGRLPDLIYPADRSWLVSMLWDDDWRCIGGNASLMRAVLTAPELDSQSVSINQDATPPGYVAR